MSSIGPTSQPGAEFLARSMDVLRQQQQEMIQKLTLAQQQAAKSVTELAKASPSPRMTMEILQAKVNDQLTALTTTVQRQQQTLKEAYTKEASAAGAMTAVQAGMSFAQAHGALESTKAELEASMAQVNSLIEQVQAQNQADMLKLQTLRQSLNTAIQSASNVMKTNSDAMRSIIQNIR
jgi:hypothetical protein